MKKGEKIFFVQNLAEILKSSLLVVLVDHTGLSVKLQQKLKERLSAVKAGMLVVKNTLLKIASDKANFTFKTKDQELLQGPTAIVFSEEKDPLPALQVLAQFAKEFQIPNLKGGILEGKLLEKTQLEKISQIPSKNFLYQQLTAILHSPLANLSNTLNANKLKLLMLLQERERILKEGGEKNG